MPTFCSQNNGIISAHYLARNAPNLAYSDPRCKKISGGETPGSPLIRGLVHGKEGRGRRWEGKFRGPVGGMGKGEEGNFSGVGAGPPKCIFLKPRLPTIF